DLPRAASSPLPGQDEPLTVSVTQDGTVFLQETELRVEQLGPRLQAITENNPEARIFVRGDRGIAYGRVMEVMGAIHGAGFSRVALITEFDQTTGATDDDL
ncbi:MAG: biopolymer transporter ExbD, partial [Geminicoccaceae bacterium]|nr:biopolymer transporter ExbD [Geminicoccaceae bacterium]